MVNGCEAVSRFRWRVAASGGGWQGLHRVGMRWHRIRKDMHSRWRVTATVVSLSGVSRSAFSRRNPGASSRQPKSRLLNSRNTPYSILSYPTFAQAAGRFAPLHGLSLVLGPSGPRVL